jgi:hypothetical protein
MEMADLANEHDSGVSALDFWAPLTMAVREKLDKC